MPGAGSEDASGQDARDELAEDVGEAEAAALEFVDQLFVVDAQEFQDRRLEVVDVDGVLDDVVAEVVAGAVRNSRLDAGAGEPEREGVGMMVAAPAGLVVDVALEEG